MADGDGRNCWLRRPEGGLWPLARDLSSRPGSGIWWRDVAGLGVLLSSLALAGMAGPGLRLAPIADRPDRPVVLVCDSPCPVPAQLADADGATMGELSPAASIEADIPDAPTRQRSLEIGRGDTLIDSLMAAGVPARDSYQAVTALKAIYDPRRLRVGQTVELGFADHAGAAALQRLSIRTAADERVLAERDESGVFRPAREPLPVSELVSFASGKIDDSLYLAAEKAGVPASVIVEMIRLFSFNVDFQREIRSGDRFEILYRRALTEEDAEVADGDILYARLDLSGRSLPLYRHAPIDDDFDDYFDADGKTARKALMKTPLDGARLTSRYGSRRHPVLGYVRAHRGLDFGAPTGTPVYAAGDGVIERSSRYGSYGNYVRIRHNDSYKTAYAHLSKYGAGIRQGVRVRQGQIIGYVGATGRVTGAHLHYEVLVDSKQVDPLRLKLPSGRTLKNDALTAFLGARQALDSDIAMLARANRLMLADAGAEAYPLVYEATAASAAR